MSQFLEHLAVAAALAVLEPAPATSPAPEAAAFPVAQTKIIETVNHWGSYVNGEGDSRTCWISSGPVKSTISRKGARRGKIWMAVTLRPGSPAVEEVNFRAGYPLAEGKPVRLSVGGRNFEMFSRGEDAWSVSVEEERKIVDAFRQGASAVVRGVSTRGTKTADTFSLIGLTAALQQAKNGCAR